MAVAQCRLILAAVLGLIHICGTSGEGGACLQYGCDAGGLFSQADFMVPDHVGIQWKGVTKPVRSEPMYSGGCVGDTEVVICQQNGTVVFLDPETGSTLSIAEDMNNSSMPVITSEGKVIVFAEASVVVYDRTGKALKRTWTLPDEVYNIVRLPTLDYYIVSLKKSGNFMVFNSSGDVILKQTFSTPEDGVWVPVAHPVVSTNNSRIYMWATPLRLLNSTDGKAGIFAFEIGSNPVSFRQVWNNTVGRRRRRFLENSLPPSPAELFKNFTLLTTPTQDIILMTGVSLMRFVDEQNTTSGDLPFISGSRYGSAFSKTSPPNAPFPSTVWMSGREDLPWWKDHIVGYDSTQPPITAGGYAIDLKLILLGTAINVTSRINSFIDKEGSQILVFGVELHTADPAFAELCYANCPTISTTSTTTSGDTQSDPLQTHFVVAIKPMAKQADASVLWVVGCPKDAIVKGQIIGIGNDMLVAYGETSQGLGFAFALQPSQRSLGKSVG